MARLWPHLHPSPRPLDGQEIISNLLTFRQLGRPSPTSGIIIATRADLMGLWQRSGHLPGREIGPWRLARRATDPDRMPSCSPKVKKVEFGRLRHEHRIFLRLPEYEVSRSHGTSAASRSEERRVGKEC